MYDDVYKYSNSLARGITRGSLSEISVKVKSTEDKFIKALRRLGTEPTTRKGAKRTLKKFNDELAPINFSWVGIDSPKQSLTMGWVLPEIIDNTLHIGAVVVTCPKGGALAVNSRHVVTITAHALSRLLQRNDDIGDLQWSTVREQMSVPMLLLWPIIMASKEAGHKQIALPAQNGLLVGCFDDAGDVVIKTYVSFPLGGKWGEVHDIYSNALTQVLEVHDHPQFVYQCCAVGVAMAAQAIT